MARGRVKAGPWYWVALNLISLAFGIAGCVVSNTYTNCTYGSYNCDHTEECPVLEGKVVWTLAAASYGLVVMGVLGGLLTFGPFPRALEKCGCESDAYCCMATFMGAFGRILYGASCVISIIINLYLLWVLNLAYPEVQSERPIDPERKYCNPVVIIMALSVVVWTFICLAILLVVALIRCWRSVRGRPKVETKKPSPTSSSQEGMNAKDTRSKKNKKSRK